MAEIRNFGRVPKVVRGSDANKKQERTLATKLRRARQAGAVQTSECAVHSNTDGAVYYEMQSSQSALQCTAVAMQCTAMQ